MEMFILGICLGLTIGLFNLKENGHERNMQ